MKSALRRRARQVVRSAPLEIPFEDPFLEVDPSVPTTRDAKTDIAERLSCVRALFALSVVTFIVSCMIIKCETCAVRDIGCGDCVLTFFLDKNREKTTHCEIPDKTAEAIDLLSSRGIVRPLRFNSA